MRQQESDEQSKAPPAATAEYIADLATELAKLADHLRLRDLAAALRKTAGHARDVPDSDWRSNVRPFSRRS